MEHGRVAAATHASPLSFCLGSGSAVVQHICQRVLELVDQELVLVTCFWAQSESLQSINDLLRLLSERAQARATHIRVRICLSSVSLLQKLTHTWSARGHVYPPGQHASRLGLPQPEHLPGLDVQVKSIFILPFSVMHPKYIIVDRKVAFLPSCNVSWESWFEGALEFNGGAVGDLFLHWRSFWARDDFSVAPELPSPSSAVHSLALRPTQRRTLFDLIPLPTSPVRSTILTSIYHRNPRFRPLPFQACPAPPKTMLNVYTLERLRTARSSVFITTPNITSPPFLDAVRDALARGVGVRIVTNDRLMTLEQLVTAGTTTPRCAAGLDEERHLGLSRQGKLRIDYYRPRFGADVDVNDEAVKLHLKLMIVDDETILLGSGNQDRASWFTSQELGMTLSSAEIAKSVRATVEKQLSVRVHTLYSSA